MKTPLFTQFNTETMTVNCPNEESEFSISISDKGRKSKAVCSISLSQAKDLAAFLSAHVKNEIKANG